MAIGRATFWFGSGTVVSRLTGLARESAIAGAFGASVVMDAFLIAFRIPNLLRDMLAEGALSGAMTKVYSALYDEDPDKAHQLITDAFKLFSLIGLSVVALGILFSPYLVQVMTILTPETPDGESLRHHAEFLTRLMFPYLLFPILGSVLMGVLHKHNRFFISSISPVAMNLGFIIGALILAPWFDGMRPEFLTVRELHPAIVGLALGVLLGGLGQFLVQFLAVASDRSWSVIFSRSRKLFSTEVKAVLVLMWPATVAASSAPINAFVNTNFATSVGEGAVTWLNFAFRLIHLPVGIFGVAVAMAALPSLASSIAKAGKRVDELASRQLQSALHLVLWLLVPSVAFFLVNALELIQFFFQHQRFTAADAAATGLALQAYAVGILGYGLIKVLTSFYFAVDRTSFAMRVSLMAIAVNLVANYLLVERFGHVGLAMTASITLSFNALILWLGMRRHGIAWQLSRFYKVGMGLALASVIGILAQRGVKYFLSEQVWFVDLPVKGQAFLVLATNGIVIATIFMLAVMRFEGTSLKRLIRPAS